MIWVRLAQLLEAGWACGGVGVNVGPPAFAFYPRVVWRCFPLAFATGLAFPAFVFGWCTDRESGRSPFASPVGFSCAFSLGSDIEELRLSSKESFALLFVAEGLREFLLDGQSQVSETDS